MLKPDAETWFSKDSNGILQPVRVVDMEDTHIVRWIQYFRRKYRDAISMSSSGAVEAVSDGLLDSLIKQEIVTAPRIYAEAAKRGLSIQEAPKPLLKIDLKTQMVNLGQLSKAMKQLGEAPKAKPKKTTKADTTEIAPGTRRITLEDD